jgi:glycosyltransferase involved in cell wall biosynthesis
LNKKAKHIALVSLDQFDPFLRDGGSHSMLTRLQFLQGQGNRVSILNFLTNEPGFRLLFDDALADPASRVVRQDNTCRAICRGLDYYQEVLPCRVEQLSAEYQAVVRPIRESIQSQRLDYVITADQDYLPLVAAWLLDIPGAHFLNALNNVQQWSRNSDYVRFLRGRPVFVESQFLQSEVEALLGLSSMIWPPPIMLDIRPDHLGEPGGKQIGFCASSGWVRKGGDIVIEVSRRMPERSFVAVGRAGTSQYTECPSNLAYWGHISDMGRFYQQIGLLLVPSLVEENFPPVIANRIGGIPEALGDSGILIDRDHSQEPDLVQIAAQYVSEIQRLLDDETLYRQYSQKALARARTYQLEQRRLASEIYEQYIL